MALIERLRRDPAGALGLGARLLAVAAVLLMYRGTARTVELHADGRTQRVWTHARTVAGALRGAGLAPGPHDHVVPSGDTPIQSGMQIELERARAVLVDVDGQARTVVSAESIPADLLAEAGAALFPGDRVWADGVRVADPAAPLPSVPARLRLASAQPLAVLAGGATLELRTAAPTLAEALWEAGLRLRAADAAQPALEAPPPHAAELAGARRVTIAADGQTIETWAGGETVGQALAAAGLAPLGLDYSLPDLEAPLPADGRIRLVRVREHFLVEQVPLPFETVYEALPDLEIDNQRLVEPGAYGVVVNRVRLRLEDGEEVARTLEGEHVAVEPQPRVVGYGTRIVIRTIDTPDGTLEYWRALTMYATSYAAMFFPPDWPWLGITASGLRLTKGLVAIDTRYIPFGTRMYVPEYGHALAADTGSGVRGRWIDLGYDDDNFVNWHRYVTVYFLTPVPDNIVWIIP